MSEPPPGSVTSSSPLVVHSTIGVLLWALGSEGASIQGLNFTLSSIYSGGVGPVASDNPPWSSRAST